MHARRSRYDLRSHYPGFAWAGSSCRCFRGQSTSSPSRISWRLLGPCSERITDCLGQSNSLSWPSWAPCWPAMPFYAFSPRPFRCSIFCSVVPVQLPRSLVEHAPRSYRASFGENTADKLPPVGADGRSEEATPEQITDYPILVLLQSTPSTAGTLYMSLSSLDRGLLKNPGWK